MTMTSKELLEKVALGEIEPDEAGRLLAELQGSQFSCKVSEKSGAVTLKGVRNPYGVTFYAGEWDRILGAADMIRKFIKDHDKELSHSKKESDERKAAYAKANPEKAAA